MQVQIFVSRDQFPDGFAESLEDSVRDGLSSFESRLTRVEVHLQDLNGHKGGVDKRCVIEARPRGMNPLAADHESGAPLDAFKGALDRLQRVLTRRFDRLESKDHRS